ncbi:MAG TPA: PaaI family thioesterase [Henriciella marina]|uniref:PaaI family thioesterase n=1 Tax=Henriciella sp. TaxID=1968823 RepID=UPI0017A0F0AC|nr:PaaI family thioesterase [Henriciella sp.]HIG22532.1 PaaI family thioesterase [Henriciella sp.]HIK65053.1 PaaI family thioesterase [Henriciella marina]
MTESNVPAGFSRHFKTSGFTDPWEPIYSRVLADRVQIGLRIADAHCNSRGFVHGALVSALADNAMGLSVGQVLKSEARKDVGGLVTVSLGTDFIGSGEIGQWLEVDTSFVRTGGSICFAAGIVEADGEPVARANATFKIVKAR